MILHGITVLLLTLFAGVALSLYITGWSINPVGMIILHFLALWVIVNLVKR